VRREQKLAPLLFQAWLNFRRCFFRFDLAVQRGHADPEHKTLTKITQ
jgi:hypothetical protein